MVDAGNARVQSGSGSGSALRVPSNYTLHIYHLHNGRSFSTSLSFECVMSLKLTLNTVAPKYSDHFEAWVPVWFWIIEVLHPGPDICWHAVHLGQDTLPPDLLRLRHVHHQHRVLGDDGLPREDGPGGHHTQPLVSNGLHCVAPTLEIGGDDSNKS